MDMMIVASPEHQTVVMITKETPRHDAQEVDRTYCFSYEIIDTITKLMKKYSIKTCSIYGPFSFIDYFAKKIEDEFGIKVKRIGVE